MEFVVDPEPTDEVRAALTEVLAAAERAPGPYESEWRRAALREPAEADEP